MDILIEGTPGAMKLRDAANDKKLTQELEKVGCELEPRKEERASSSGWGLTPERTVPNTARELCWDQVASPKQSGISDVGWKWEEEQAHWSGKELLHCAPASTDTQACGSQGMSLF